MFRPSPLSWIQWRCRKDTPPPNRPSCGAWRSRCSKQSRRRRQTAGRALLEGLQRNVWADSWVALRQVDRAARQASFWSLTSLGVLERTTLTLTPDVPAECGPSGKADVATLTRLESFPAVLAQMERAGIDRFERILPEHTAPDPMQTLMVAGPARCAMPLTRCWTNVTFSLAALLLRAPQTDGGQGESQRANG